MPGLLRGERKHSLRKRVSDRKEKIKQKRGVSHEDKRPTLWACQADLVATRFGFLSRRFRENWNCSVMLE